MSRQTYLIHVVPSTIERKFTFVSSSISYKNIALNGFKNNKNSLTFHGYIYVQSQFTNKYESLLPYIMFLSPSLRTSSLCRDTFVKVVAGVEWKFYIPTNKKSVLDLSFISRKKRFFLLDGYAARLIDMLLGITCLYYIILFASGYFVKVVLGVE